MSNKHEIEEDLYRAQSRLDDLCKQEGQENTGTQTVTIQPKYGEEMQSLREECSQLRIILLCLLLLTYFSMVCQIGY